MMTIECDKMLNCYCFESLWRKTYLLTHGNKKMHAELIKTSTEMPCRNVSAGGWAGKLCRTVALLSTLSFLQVVVN